MKRQFILAAILITGIPILVSCCQNRPDAQAILDKAIVAHGGKAELCKPRTGMLKGTDKAFGREVNQQEWFDLPRKWKRVTSATFGGRKRVSVNLMVDGNLWQWEDGAEPEQAKNRGSAAPYFASLMLLIGLKESKAQMATLKPIKVNDHVAVGLRASLNGGGGDYYFDKDSGLLVQSNIAWEPEPGKHYQLRTVYGEYKEMAGVKLAYRRTMYATAEKSSDEVLIADFQVTEIKVQNAIPAEVFALPPETERKNKAH